MNSPPTVAEDPAEIEGIVTDFVGRIAGWYDSET